jgi:hypothetical protein
MPTLHPERPSDVIARGRLGREISCEATPLERSPWYQAKPEPVRRRIDLAWRAHLLDAARARSITIRDALLAVAPTRTATATDFEDVLRTAELEHRRATAFRSLRDQLALDLGERIPPPRQERLASWWPDLALVVSAIVPDPAGAMLRLDPLGVPPDSPLIVACIDAAPAARAVLALAIARARALPPWRAFALGLAAPLAVARALRATRRLPDDFRRIHAIPPEVAEHVDRTSPYFALAMRSALANARLLCEEVRMLRGPLRPLWRLAGLHPC